MAGDVAAQDRVDRDPLAGGAASLGEQLRRDRRGASGAALQRRDRVGDGGADRRAQACHVVGVSDLAGIGDRVDAGQYRLLDLRAALTEALGQLLANLLDAPSDRQDCSGRFATPAFTGGDRRARVPSCPDACD